MPNAPESCSAAPGIVLEKSYEGFPGKSESTSHPTLAHIPEEKFIFWPDDTRYLASNALTDGGCDGNGVGGDTNMWFAPNLAAGVTDAVMV